MKNTILGDLFLREIGGEGVVSLGITWIHLVSLEPPWSLLRSLGLTWFHSVSLVFIRIDLV